MKVKESKDRRQENKKGAKEKLSDDVNVKETNGASRPDAAPNGDKSSGKATKDGRKDGGAAQPAGRRKPGGGRRRSTSSSSSSSGSSSSSSSGSSSSDSSSVSDSDTGDAAVAPVAKPLFVPKGRRRAAAEAKEAEKAEELAEAARMAQREKEKMKSRALVAEVVAADSLENKTANLGLLGDDDDDGEGEEFDSKGGCAMPPPDDRDDGFEEEEEERRREAWEIRELLRILRDHDARMAVVREASELARRRAMTDEDRLAEDVASGRYKRPGEARRRPKSEKDSHFMQRYHHRGAFYMDEDTLKDAGEDDVRRKAAEYARAATGEDKFDRKAMPEVMQVKNFGFAGYSTKYKGLAREDTTDRGAEVLPLAGRGRGRGRGRGDYSAGRGRGGDYYYGGAR